MLSASDWKAAFRHWPNTNHWLPSIVDPFILEIRAPPPCFSPYARQGLAKSLGFIDGPWRWWKGAASFVSRLLINGPLWPVFSSQFLPVAMSFPVSFDLLMRRPILVYSPHVLSSLPTGWGAGPRIPKFFVQGLMIPARSVTPPIFIDSTLGIREPIPWCWFPGNANGSRSNFDRVRVGMAGGGGGYASGSPCCTFLCSKLMPKRADARWIPSNYTHR